MQKKSHNRKFQVGQLVKVLRSVSVTRNPRFSWIELISLFGKEFIIQEYKFQTGAQQKLAQNYKVGGILVLSQRTRSC